MKFRYAIFFILMLILLAACSARKTGQPLKVTVATDPNYPPFEQVEGKQAFFTGLDIDVMNAVAAKSNLQVEYDSVRYNHIMDEMADCKYDASISALTVNDADKKRVLFTDPYLTAGQVIVVRQENVEVTGRDRLADREVGVQQETTGEQEGKKIAGARIAPYRALLPMLDDLDNGLIDAAIADKPSVLYYIGQEYSGLKIAGGEWAKEEYAIAVCSQKADLVKQINQALFWMKLDGTIDKLTKKWLLNK